MTWVGARWTVYCSVAPDTTYRFTFFSSLCSFFFCSFLAARINHWFNHCLGSNVIMSVPQMKLAAPTAPPAPVVLENPAVTRFSLSGKTAIGVSTIVEKDYGLGF